MGLLYCAMRKEDLKKNKVRTKLKKILTAIHIALDDYEDIFSDFDISPYDKRALSQDFIGELLARCHSEIRGDVEIVLSLPREERDPEDEAIISERIRAYFDDRVKELEGRINELKQKGFLFLVVGVFFLIFALFVPDFHLSERLTDIIGDVIATPLGWFFTWTGLSMLIEEPGEYKKDLELFRKLKNASIIFVDEEQILREVG